jgi:hypothetical protein
MKKLICLLVLGILLSGCSLLPFSPASTPTPADTPTSGLLIATFTPLGPLQVLPSQIPTLEPITTETPMDLSTAAPEDTQTPEDTETPEDTQTPEYIPTSVPPTLITSVSVDVSFHANKCTTTTPVTFSGTITLDQANFTEVDYRWVISGTISHIGTINRTNISSARTFDIHPSTYQLGCGSYTVGLQILAPNVVTDKKSFTIP